MPHYAPIRFSHERDREPLGGTQCGNDELLCLITDCQSLERSGSNLGDGADIGARFTSDEYLVRHVSEFISWLANDKAKGRAPRTKQTNQPAPTFVARIPLGRLV